MKKENLARAASFLSKETEYAKITGKSITADSLEQDIVSVFDQTNGIEAVFDFYNGFQEMLQNTYKVDHSIETMLKICKDYIDDTVLSNVPNDQRRVSAFVLSTLSSVKAVIDFIESTHTFEEQNDNLDTNEHNKSNLTLINIIETIDWDMKKSDISNAFAYMDSLPPHPTQNAIGFATEIYDISSAVICYFSKKLFKEILGAVNIIIYEEPPMPVELATTFKTVVNELTSRYGEPRANHENYKVWIMRGRVLVVSTTTGVLGIRFGDPKIDLPSKLAIGTA